MTVNSTNSELMQDNSLTEYVSLAITANALKSTKAQLAHVQSQLADEVAHASELQHALQAERVANNEYMQKTKKADDTRDAFMRVANDLDVVPIDDGVRKSAIDSQGDLLLAYIDALHAFAKCKAENERVASILGELVRGQ